MGLCVCVWERERPCHLCRVLSYINVSARQPEGLAADYFLSAHASNAASSCQELFSRPPFLFHPFWDNNILTAAEWSVAVWGGLTRQSKKKKEIIEERQPPHSLFLLCYFSIIWILSAHQLMWRYVNRICSTSFISLVLYVKLSTYSLCWWV